MKKPTLDFSECEILSLLKDHETLSRMALVLNMDKGQLSRKISKISDTAPVLTKIQGKWSLTSQGIDLVEWYKGILREQTDILSRKRELSIVTTQNISERIVCSKTPEIKNLSGYESIRISTSVSSVESDLLSGKIDFALLCSIPENPEIRYKKLFKSRFRIVFPYRWKQTPDDIQSLLSLPYVTHTGLDVRHFLNIENNISAPFARYDHLSGVRQGVIEGQGWAILPEYAVLNEISEKKLKFSDNSWGLSASEEFQLWWFPGKTEKKMAMKISDLFAF